MYGWHCEYPVKGPEDNHAEDALVGELRNKCYAESTRLLIEAIREMQSESGTDLEVTSLKIRKAVEYIMHDLYYHNWGVSRGVEPPTKKRSDWYDEKKGFGKSIDNNHMVQFNTAIDASKIGIHPEVKTSQDRETLDLAMHSTLFLYTWWANNFLSEDIPDMISDTHKQGKTAWSSEAHFEGPDEDRDENQLLGLAITAITIAGGREELVPLSAVHISKIDPEFKPRNEGFHTTLHMMLSFQEHIMVVRDKNSLPYVKIRGDDDPMPPWAYKNVHLSVLIKDAIDQIEGEYGWVYTRDLEDSIKSLYPEFKVRDYGFTSLMNMCGNLGLKFELNLSGVDSRIRVSPIIDLSRAIIYSPVKIVQGDTQWVSCDVLRDSINSESHRASPERFGFDGIKEMTSAYPLFFQYTDDMGGNGPAVRILYWKTDLKNAFTSCISSLADEQGWATMAQVGERMLEEIPGFSTKDYGYKTLKHLMVEILGDKIQFAQPSMKGKHPAAVRRIKKTGFKEGMLSVRIKVPVDYEGITVKQLIGIARERGISGYSKLKKADLIELIRANESD